MLGLNSHIWSSVLVGIQLVGAGLLSLDPSIAFDQLCPSTYKWWPWRPWLQDNRTQTHTYTHTHTQYTQVYISISSRQICRVYWDEKIYSTNGWTGFFNQTFSTPSMAVLDFSFRVLVPESKMIQAERAKFTNVSVPALKETSHLRDFIIDSWKGVFALENQ